MRAPAEALLTIPRRWVRSSSLTAAARPRVAIGRKTLLLLASLLLTICHLISCHPAAGEKDSRFQTPANTAYSLPSSRPEGNWRPPSNPEERKQLNTVVQKSDPGFQECMWRYAGATMVGRDNLPSSPLVATFGVNQTGKVVWLQLANTHFSSYSLRECLSRELLRMEFTPPPAEPTILVLTVLPLRVSSLE